MRWTPRGVRTIPITHSPTCGSSAHGPAVDADRLSGPADPFAADRILPGCRRRGGAARCRTAAAAGRVDHRLRLAELGAAGDSVVRLRWFADGTGRHVSGAGRAGASPGRLGARRAGHVGDRRVLFLLRYLRLEDGGGLSVGI